ncbi:hypothetical protein Acsp04_49650 [Actinomadura sp. NBRC 104425]|uniref:hypothetical protein n=1 Tax=Actinomadura sp. NBRC 104425 TaxID=3032204 RepID=UPI0024A53B29|nr:hypothetical protein [Actinomadura sp. NBRC 104425]GLZ14730.1 hypothetical protein Acsp04_49650 [Actinomadura sp. NBRC 104425]
MDERAETHDPLWPLSLRLAKRGLVVERGADGLCVAVEGDPDARDTITCRPRPEDGGRLWFWTSRGEPIAEADGRHTDDAALYVFAHLARRQGDAGARR